MGKVFRKKLSKGTPGPFKGKLGGTPKVKHREFHPDQASKKGPVTPQMRRPMMDPTAC